MKNVSSSGTTVNKVLDKVKGQFIKIKLVDQPDLSWEVNVGAGQNKLGAAISGGTLSGAASMWRIVDIESIYDVTTAKYVPTGFFRLES